MHGGGRLPHGSFRIAAGIAVGTDRPPPPEADGRLRRKAERLMHSDILAMIDTDRLVHNYRAVRACCRPNVLLCAMLKGDAYGHAIAIVAPVLQAAGVEFAAVATLQEAVDLRFAGWQQSDASRRFDSAQSPAYH